jgi:hypothetical protein
LIAIAYFQDEQLAFLVDPVLDTEDVNRDGFIDYPEYLATTLKQRVKENNKRGTVAAS